LLRLVEGRVPAFEPGLLVRLDHRPKLDRARRVGAYRIMDGRARHLGQAREGCRLPEDGIDRVEHERRRTEGILEPHVREAHVGRFERGSIVTLVLLELRRYRALEREDRLLLVPDRED